MLTKIVTIGVYGFDPERFAEALRGASVDTLVDIRRRRGVRGHEYAFANSQRLQALLAELGIRYVHDLSLAPPQTVREIQAHADEAQHVARRKRTELSDEFVQAYEREVLSQFEPLDFPGRLPADARVAALLCVEREPEACHRSLAAACLSAALNIPVEHLRP